MTPTRESMGLALPHADAVALLSLVAFDSRRTDDWRFFGRPLTTAEKLYVQYATADQWAAAAADRATDPAAVPSPAFEEVRQGYLLAQRSMAAYSAANPDDPAELDEVQFVRDNLDRADFDMLLAYIKGAIEAEADPELRAWLLDAVDRWHVVVQPNGTEPGYVVATVGDRFYVNVHRTRLGLFRPDELAA